MEIGISIERQSEEQVVLHTCGHSFVFLKGDGFEDITIDLDHSEFRGCSQPDEVVMHEVSELARSILWPAVTSKKPNLRLVK
jgi:hypothetical protein